MADVNPQKIQQPASGAAPTPGMPARVFTMPERYRHGAEGKMHEPMAKQPAAVSVQVNTPAIPAPKSSTKAPDVQEEGINDKEASGDRRCGVAGARGGWVSPRLSHT